MVVAKVETDKAQYRSGEKINAILTLTNDADKTVEVFFRTAQRYDFVIKNPNGEALWCWSEGKMFAMVWGSLVLGAGEKKGFSAFWDSTGAVVGEYYLTGIVTSEPSLCSSCRFELV